jgi:hypothetical protein
MFTLSAVAGMLNVAVTRALLFTLYAVDDDDDDDDDDDAFVDIFLRETSGKMFICLHLFLVFKKKIYNIL